MLYGHIQRTGEEMRFDLEAKVRIKPGKWLGVNRWEVFLSKYLH